MTIQKKTILSIYSVLLVVVAMLGEINESTLLFSLLLLGITLLLFNPIFIIPVYVITSLGNNFFAYNGVSLSRIIGFFLIISCILHLVQRGIKLQKQEFIFIVIFFVFTFISAAFSVTSSFTSFISFAQSLIIVFLLCQFRNIDINNLSWMLVIASSLAIILFTVWFKENYVEFGMRRLAVSEDSSINRLATMISQLLAMIFGGFFISKKKFSKVYFTITIFIGLFLIILTGTRAALIAIVLTILIFGLQFLRKYKQKVLISLPLIFILGYFFLLQIEQLDSSLIERFTIEKIQDDGGSGRIDIWKKLVPKTIEDGLFFGFGFGGENGYHIAQQNGLKYSAHNFVIDMFIQMGLIGLILFFTYFSFLASKLYRLKNNPLIKIPILILFTGLINGIGETVFLEKFFWNGIALAWLYLNNLQEHPKHLCQQNN